MMTREKANFATFLFLSLILATTYCFSAESILPTKTDPFKDKAKAMMVNPDVLKSAISETKYNHDYGQEWDARVNVIKGNILLKAAKSDRVTKFESGTVIPISNGDIVRVEKNSEAEVKFYDKAIIRIAEKSELQFISLNKSDTYLSLRYGLIKGKIRHLLNKTFKFRLKTIYTNSVIEEAAFAAGYVSKTKTTAIAVFDKGNMSVSTINEFGSSLGLYTLTDGKEIVYSALLPEKDEKGVKKGDVDYYPSDIIVTPKPVSDMEGLKTEIETITRETADLRKNWIKYAEGEREKVRAQVLATGQKMISSVEVRIGADRQYLEDY